MGATYRGSGAAGETSGGIESGTVDPEPNLPAACSIWERGRRGLGSETESVGVALWARTRGRGAAAGRKGIDRSGTGRAG
jgi:hypothetical protein